MLGSLLPFCSRKQRFRGWGNDCVTKMLLHRCANLTSNPSSHVKREKLGAPALELKTGEIPSAC